MRLCRKLLLFALAGPLLALAQQQEIGLTLGGLAPLDRTVSTGEAFHVSGGTALQANYAVRVFHSGPAGLWLGVHLLASPQRTVESSNGLVTRDIASLYVTPNVMLKMFEQKRLVPWVSFGGGYGDYEQSTQTINGSANSASRELGRGVLMFGGGIDVPVWRFVSLRGEIRDFYTGSPAYNLPVSGGQHNVVFGGGFVLRLKHR